MGLSFLTVAATMAQRDYVGTFTSLPPFNRHVRRWKPSIADRLEDVATSLLDVAYAVEAIAEQRLSGLGNES